MFVVITQEMIDRANIEIQRRDPYIKHHFSVDHLTEHDRDMIGFLGEFAMSELLGVDFTKQIRDNYFTIDCGDGQIQSLVYDVKTETIPELYFEKVVNRQINDNEKFGRRLINKGQVQLLNKYDIVIFGAFKRNDYTKWYPIGYQTTEYILNNYEITNQRPDGGIYPFSALPIKTSSLIDITKIMPNRRS